MPYEVELKFPVQNPDEVVVRILAAGGTREATRRQSDTYFNHPSRDFAQTDEAFRIRNDDGRHRVTYKGPKVDAATKSRREIEVPFGDSHDDDKRFAEILTSLSFRKVGTVHKTRTFFTLTRNRHAFECCLDVVDNLGTFVELETTADDETLDAARDAVLQLAAELGLENPERRSYLCLLLENESY